MFNLGDYLSSQDLGMQIAVMAAIIFGLVVFGYSLGWLFRKSATRLGHAILGIISVGFLAFLLNMQLTEEHPIMTGWMAIFCGFGYSLYPFRVRWPRLWSWVFGTRPTIQTDQRMHYSGMRPADNYPKLGAKEVLPTVYDAHGHPVELISSAANTTRVVNLRR